MEKPKEITVRYTVFNSDIRAIQELADHYGRTLEDQFRMMMLGGCLYDIQGKIKFWQQMRENELKKGEGK